jgi:hypothetical protein
MHVIDGYPEPIEPEFADDSAAYNEVIAARLERTPARHRGDPSLETK